MRKHLDAIPNSFWIKIQLVSLRGIPDFLGCVEGRFCALELKIETNTTDSLQTWTLKKLAKCGAYTAVVKPSNLDTVIKELNNIGGTSCLES